MAKNINNKAFKEETQLKLDIFRECFREWFPVFLHNPYVSHIYIYDLFAGSGTDAEGKYGSPLILLEEARGENTKHCSVIKKGSKQITFILNEKEKTKKQEKFELLQSNVMSFFLKCKEDNTCEEECVYKHYCTNKGFKDGFNDNSTDFHKILNNSKYAKFILLDQYGFSQIDNNVFNKLIGSPKTDFIFFIATSFITRFKEHENTKKYIDTNKIEFDPTKPHECHRTIANYYQSLIPSDKEYYLHHFTIENGANIQLQNWDIEEKIKYMLENSSISMLQVKKLIKYLQEATEIANSRRERKTKNYYLAQVISLVDQRENDLIRFALKRWKLPNEKFNRFLKIDVFESNDLRQPHNYFLKEDK